MPRAPATCGRSVGTAFLRLAGFLAAASLFPSGPRAAEPAAAPVPPTASTGARRLEARWIWAPVAVREPFQFVRFRKAFEVVGAAERATAFVAADTLYRLWINGELAMHGPARSSRGQATVDPVEVTSLLRPGQNTLEAEVLHYDGRFEALGQAPGFLCELEVTADGHRQIVATDATWEGAEVTAWSRASPKFSFQRTWVEDFDARQELAVTWRPAVVLGDVGMSPWPTVELRDVPLPNPRRILKPARVLSVQRGDGFTGEMEATRYGPRPAWVRRLQTERVRADESAAAQPRALTRDGDGHTVLEGDGASLVYDLGANEVGFIGFELSGAAGQTLEFAWNESLDDPGRTVRPVQGIDANQALRYTLREGRQAFLTFNPYLLRFLRVVQRGAGKLTLHRLWLADFSFAAPSQGEFECSDAGLNRVYEAAKRTARLNTLDTFMDNPSRERGAWMREGYWTARAVYTCFGDLSVSRRMVLQGADSQSAAVRAGPPGMVQMLYPGDISVDRTYIPAHALYWVLQAGLHERVAGNQPFVGAILPAVRRLIAAFQTFESPEGLIEHDGSFIDPVPMRGDGVSVALNAIYVRTLDEVARLERSLGETGRAAQATQQAARVRETLNRLAGGDLFYPDVFTRNTLRQLVPAPERSETTQYFLLWADAVPAERARRLWQVLRDECLPTPGRDTPVIQGLTRGALYSFLERLQVAARRGDHAALVRDAKAMYLPMADCPPGTLWEHTLRQWCLCQGFSSGVAAGLSEEILGIRDELPARIAPHGGGAVRWCKGHVTTPRGRVAVAWDSKPDRYALTVTLPADVTAEVLLPPEAEAVWRLGTPPGDWKASLPVTGQATIVVTPGTLSGPSSPAHP